MTHFTGFLFLTSALLSLVPSLVANAERESHGTNGIVAEKLQRYATSVATAIALENLPTEKQQLAFIKKYEAQTSYFSREAGREGLRLEQTDSQRSLWAEGKTWDESSDKWILLCDFIAGIEKIQVDCVTLFKDYSMENSDSESYLERGLSTTGI